MKNKQKFLKDLKESIEFSLILFAPTITVLIIVALVDYFH
jgi:peptidoglycan biosynthesis protein MviN/MurJ (putative lipid II flippase)